MFSIGKLFGGTNPYQDFMDFKLDDKQSESDIEKFLQLEQESLTNLREDYDNKTIDENEHDEQVQKIQQKLEEALALRKTVPAYANKEKDLTEAARKLPYFNVSSASSSPFKIRQPSLEKAQKIVDQMSVKNYRLYASDANELLESLNFSVGEVQEAFGRKELDTETYIQELNRIEDLISVVQHRYASKTHIQKRRTDITRISNKIKGLKNAVASSSVKSPSKTSSTATSPSATPSKTGFRKPLPKLSKTPPLTSSAIAASRKTPPKERKPIVIAPDDYEEYQAQPSKPQKNLPPPRSGSKVQLGSGAFRYMVLNEADKKQLLQDYQTYGGKIYLQTKTGFQTVQPKDVMLGGIYILQTEAGGSLHVGGKIKWKPALKKAGKIAKEVVQVADKITKTKTYQDLEKKHQLGLTPYVRAAKDISDAVGGSSHIGGGFGAINRKVHRLVNATGKAAKTLTEKADQVTSNPAWTAASIMVPELGFITAASKAGKTAVEVGEKLAARRYGQAAEALGKGAINTASFGLLGGGRSSLQFMLHRLNNSGHKMPGLSKTYPSFETLQSGHVPPAPRENQEPKKSGFVPDHLQVLGGKVYRKPTLQSLLYEPIPLQAF